MRDAIAAVSSSKNTQPILRHAALYLTQFIHTCLFAEVDGNVGYGQRHQESDERPVVRERREFHHDRLEAAPPTSAARVWKDARPVTARRVLSVF